MLKHHCVCGYLVDERNENHSLPFLLLAIEIRFKVKRIVLDDGRILTGHQVLEYQKWHISNV